jgi:drug/metabolite transporter (DMT)-like permease
MEESNVLKMFFLGMQFVIVLMLGGMAFYYAYLNMPQYTNMILTGLLGYLSPQIITAMTSKNDKD